MTLLFDIMELSSATWAILFGGLLLWVGFIYFVFRWALSIERQLWNQKQTVALLIMLCQKAGVAEGELNWIKDIIEDKKDID